MGLDCFVQKDASLAQLMRWQLSCRASGSHEVPVEPNTCVTFLISNSNPNNHDHLHRWLYNGTDNDPQCVCLCILQFSQEYLILSAYCSVIAVFIFHCRIL